MLCVIVLATYSVLVVCIMDAIWCLLAPPLTPPLAMTCVVGSLHAACMYCMGPGDALIMVKHACILTCPKASCCV